MPGHSPKISVIIPTFNRAKYLRECLESIFAQTSPASQIIVINDASSDNTKNICQSYGNKIEYYEQSKQIGKPSAINFALEKVTGDYVWIFDDDDVAFPEALERFVEPLEKNPQYGFSYSTFYFSDSAEDDRIGEIQFELKIPDLEKRGPLVPLLESNYLGGAALFARTSCYKEAGPFDPHLLRSQDYEMAIRIVRRFKGVRVPGGPTFHYRQHEGIRGATNDRFSVSDRKKKWLEYDQRFFRKLYKEVPLAEYLPPGKSIEKSGRQAILQRLAIMSYKMMMPEVVADLYKLADSKDQTSISEEEYLILREMVTHLPRYDMGSIFDRLEFFNKVRELSLLRSFVY
jgi:glycosyltransferase involved in cell wall biosynthesis